MEQIEKESTREANKKSKELMQDVRIFQHKYLPPKKVVTSTTPETNNSRIKNEAMRMFRKEKRNFKYDS